MSKLDDIAADVAALDAMIAPNPERARLNGEINAIEDAIEKLSLDLRGAVRSLDALDSLDDPAKKAASARAVEISVKYGKSIAELRAILASVG